jgi:cobalt-zinc-cadmium efflux system membrane fusion protein
LSFSVMRPCFVLLVCLASLPLSGCGGSPAERPADDGNAGSPRGVVVVPSEQQQAIGLTAQAVTRRETQDTLQLTGWLAARPQGEVVIKAPAPGFLTAGDKREIATLGSFVKSGDRLATLQVFLSPQEQLQLVASKEDADTAIEQAAVSMELAAAQLERLKSAPGTVSGTRINDLEEIYRRSKVAQQEARDKLPFLPQEPYASSLSLKPVAVEAPISGRIIQVHINPRQLVLSGDVLWTLADWSTLWVRVPVFETDLPRVKEDADVYLTLAGVPEPLRATRIAAPQPAKPGQRTVDVWLEVPNPKDQLRPGQAVTVSLPTQTPASRVVIPRSAVLWDGMGNSWVYLRAGPESFKRQQVELGTALADGVVVERGLSGGEQIVTESVESLYGEEFKSDLQADED